jgi:hypothetical protein
VIRIGSHPFAGPFDVPDRLGRRRAGVLAVLDPATGRVEAVEGHADLAAGAATHPARRYAAAYTDLYTTVDARTATASRDRLAAIVRAELEEPSPTRREWR